MRAACARVLEVDPGTVDLTSSLSEDLGADSLAVVGVVELVEADLAARRPGFAVPDEALDGLRTVGDLVAVAQRELEARR